MLNNFRAQPKTRIWLGRETRDIEASFDVVGAEVAVLEVRQGGLSELASLIIEISKIQWEAAVPLGFVNVNVKVNDRLEVGTGRLGEASVPRWN